MNTRRKFIATTAAILAGGTAGALVATTTNKIRSHTDKHLYWTPVGPEGCYYLTKKADEIVFGISHPEMHLRRDRFEFMRDKILEMKAWRGYDERPVCHIGYRTGMQVMDISRCNDTHRGFVLVDMLQEQLFPDGECVVTLYHYIAGNTEDIPWRDMFCFTLGRPIGQTISPDDIPVAGGKPERIIHGFGVPDMPEYTYITNKF